MKEKSMYLDTGKYKDSVSIRIFLKYFENKDDFLESEEIIKLNKDYFSKKILLEEKTRIGELGWQIIHQKHPGILTFEDHKSILYILIKQAPKLLKGHDELLYPLEGDIIFGKPENKSLHVIVPDGLDIKRSHINKKFGFGEMDIYGYQFARYNQNLIPKPI